MTKMSLGLLALLGTVALLGCGSSAGNPCNARTYEGLSSCSSTTETLNCAACPSSSGYSSEQGVCGEGLEASDYDCELAWPTPGGSGGSGENCNEAWTCSYDGQATPMCEAACNYQGDQRTQTCEVLASMLESGNAGECCSVCR